MPLSDIALRPLLALGLVATAGLVSADPNDWVNVDYVIKQANIDNTAFARQNIVSKAGITARDGPWTVSTSKDIPPSGDVLDYLSWAPYHWPNCNWCSKGTNHLSHPSQGNSTDDGNDDGDDDDDDDGDYKGDNPYENGGDDNLLLIAEMPSLFSKSSSGGGHYGASHRRMLKRRRGHGVSDTAVSRRQDTSPPTLPVPPDDVPSMPSVNVPTPPPLPAAPPALGSPPLPPVGFPSSSTGRTFHGTPAPAQAPAKTSSAADKCTPSPTKSLPPSATWTTCPYQVHDGKVNPDVRELPDSPAVVDMSQAVLYNAIAYGMQGSKLPSQNAANFVNTWFLGSSTGMNPNVNYGQQVRGPGKDHQMGTYTGILDLRGTVKVINGIAILKAAGSPDWTSAMDQKMTTWMKSYTTWMQNSALGKEAASKANNHLSFFVSQLAAAKMYTGDTKGAQTVLKNYFANQFKDQIAASGEQPFEAVRTRPYHYRCFNLEAMITNAKLGDQMGMNFWTAKSKYGATIQTALDYVMALNPGNEDVSDIFPHVAAVAAAYGDPKGKYATFLRNKAGNSYTTQPYYFYDQSAALPNSPAGQAAVKKQRREIDVEQDNASASDVQNDLVMDIGTAQTMAVDAEGGVESGDIPFVCPAVFDTATETELDNGIYTSCADLKPYYELKLPVDPDVM